MIPIVLGAMALGALGTGAVIKTSRLNQKIETNINSFNAAINTANADAVLKSAHNKVKDINKATDLAVSSARAELGASNLVTTSGSPLFAQQRLREEGNIAAQNAILEGNFGAAQFKNQSALDLYKNQIARVKGQQERQNAILTGFAGTGENLLKLS